MGKDHLIKVCFVGSARYRKPLDTTSERKFQTLKSLGDLFVIGFSQDLMPRRFTQYARFYLLSELPLAVLRYVEMFIVAPLLVLWLIFRHGIHILVTQSPYEGIVAAWAKIIAGWFGRTIVLVVESHGDFEEDFFLQSKKVFPQLYRFFMRHAARFTLNRADVLRAISHSTRQQLEQWRPGKNVFQFITWTDIDCFFKAGGMQEKSLESILLYVGVLIPRKGIIHLVNAFARVAEKFPESRLVLIGREENQAYVNELKKQIKHYGIESRVQFVQEISQAELARWMVRSLGLVLPSYSEGLGRVVVEAMAAGIPVIGSQVGGIPDMITDGETGFLLPPGDETALTEKIHWLLKHPKEAQRMGQKAHDFAKRFFCREVYVRGYQQIFETAQNLLEP